MNKLIDHTFNYLRFALLGTAVAFLILPHSLLARQQGVDPWGDNDNDDILNRIDVCIDEDYDMSYHSSCLNFEGVTFVNFQDRVNSIVSSKALLLTGSFGLMVTFIIREATNWILTRLIGDVPPSNYETAALKTCANLFEFKKSNQRMAGRIRWTAWGATIAAVLWPGTIGKVIAGLIAASLHMLANDYNSAKVNADNAWQSLCTYNRNR